MPKDVKIVNKIEWLMYEFHISTSQGIPNLQSELKSDQQKLSSGPKCDGWAVNSGDLLQRLMQRLD